MQIIAHRANLQGPSKEENSPLSINRAIDQGFMVEVDINTPELVSSAAVFRDEQGHKDFVLGHQGGGHYYVGIDFVVDIAPYTYFHAKDLKVLNHLLHLRCIPYVFFHDNDAGVMTSNGKIWTFPQFPLYGNSIAVMPETWYGDSLNLQANLDKFKKLNCWGVCTDWAWYARKELN